MNKRSSSIFICPTQKSRGLSEQGAYEWDCSSEHKEMCKAYENVGAVLELKFVIHGGSDTEIFEAIS